MNKSNLIPERVVKSQTTAMLYRMEYEVVLLDAVIAEELLFMSSRKTDEIKTDSECEIEICCQAVSFYESDSGVRFHN
jgi:hypothetical protein